MVTEGNRRTPDPTNQAAEEAAFWDARLRSPDCTDADRARFALWRDQSAKHRSEFERLQHIAALARQEVSRADLRALRDAARRAASRCRWRMPAATVAALVVVAIGAAHFIPRLDRTSGNPLRSSMTPTAAQETAKPGEQYATQVGQRSTVTLQDGSTVEIDAQSLVRVEFTAQHRRVELVSGQALFHVAKNFQRPFVVRAGDREILAIGTEFDVRRDSNSVSVTLVEGRVSVTRQSISDEPAGLTSPLALGQAPTKKGASLPTPSSPESGSASAQQWIADQSPAARIFLEPGQQSITQELSGETRVVSVDVQKVIGWRNGRVTFEDVTLADAVAEMNRHSPRQIRLADPELVQQHISGAFRAGEQDAFVEALQSYFPLGVELNDDTEIVLVRRTTHPLNSTVTHLPDNR